MTRESRAEPPVSYKVIVTWLSSEHPTREEALVASRAISRRGLMIPGNDPEAKVVVVETISRLTATAASSSKSGTQRTTRTRVTTGKTKRVKKRSDR